jgi:hypothetical protein
MALADTHLKSVSILIRKQQHSELRVLLFA